MIETHAHTHYCTKKSLCRDCRGSGQYWTEWSQAGMDDPETRRLLIALSEPYDGTALIICNACEGTGHVVDSARTYDEGGDNWHVTVERVVNADGRYFYNVTVREYEVVTTLTHIMTGGAARAIAKGIVAVVR